VKIKVKGLRDLVELDAPVIPTCLLKLSISQEEVEVADNGKCFNLEDGTVWLKKFFVVPKTFKKDQKVMVSGVGRRYYSHYDGTHHHCFTNGTDSWSSMGCTFIADEVTEVTD
jgi:hypothetical protein